MGRKPRIHVDANGDASIRVIVPRPLWLMCGVIAQRWKIPQDAAFAIVLDKLGGLLADPHRGAHYASTLLGPEFVEAFQQTKRENFGRITSGPAIDISRLHRSTKTKSGFAGVYVSGKGFRAMVRIKDSRDQKHLGTYDIAEEAAWARLLYYEANDLPYGVWEEVIDQRRAEGKTGPDSALIYDYEDTNRLSGTEDLNLAPGKPRYPNEDPFTRNVTDELHDLQAANVARDKQLREETKKRAQDAAQRTLGNGALDDDDPDLVDDDL